MKNALFILLAAMVYCSLGAHGYSIKGGPCGRPSRSCKASCRTRSGNGTIPVAPLRHATYLAPNSTTIPASITSHVLTSAPIPSISNTNATSAVTVVSSSTPVGVSSTLGVLLSSNTNSLSSSTPTHLASTSRGYHTNPLPTHMAYMVVLLALWRYV